MPLRDDDNGLSEMRRMSVLGEGDRVREGSAVGEHVGLPGAALPGPPGVVKAGARPRTGWLRHTFALQILAANRGDLPALQDLLGHEDLSTTGIYVRAALGHGARRVAKMERFF